MARIEIRVREEFRKKIDNGRFIHPSGYQILVDGREIDGLTAVQLTWAHDEVPEAHLVMNVDHIDIDAVALANLQAIVKAKETVDA